MKTGFMLPPSSFILYLVKSILMGEVGQVPLILERSMKMTAFSLETIQSYRARTFRQVPGQRIHTQDEAIEFVRQRGFVFFWPIKDIAPSLWVALRDRLVRRHDDRDMSPGVGILLECAWYYAKSCAKAMVSMDTASLLCAVRKLALRRIT
jgi:hypothetical protein